MHSAQLEAYVVQNTAAAGCCVVLGDPLEVEGEPQLIVFVMPHTVQSQDVMKACSDDLPRHMVPSRVCSVASFPLTPSGKVGLRHLI